MSNPTSAGPPDGVERGWPPPGCSTSGGPAVSRVASTGRESGATGEPRKAPASQRRQGDTVTLAGEPPHYAATYEGGVMCGGCGKEWPCR